MSSRSRRVPRGSFAAAAFSKHRTQNTPQPQAYVPQQQPQEVIVPIQEDYWSQQQQQHHYQQHTVQKVHNKSPITSSGAARDSAASFVLSATLALVSTLVFVKTTVNPDMLWAEALSVLWIISALILLLAAGRAIEIKSDRGLRNQTKAGAMAAVAQIVTFALGLGVFTWLLVLFLDAEGDPPYSIGVPLLVWPATWVVVAVISLIERLVRGFQGAYV